MTPVPAISAIKTDIAAASLIVAGPKLASLRNSSVGSVT
jgi:hypothetical protein